VISEVFISLLLVATPLYGDDVLTAMANQLGYEQRPDACSSRKGEVRVAISAAGRVTYDGRQRPPLEVARMLHANRLDIRNICLYVEGPMSSASHSAFSQIMKSIATNNLGVFRFTGPNFTERVFPKVPLPSPAK
jgi:hypothetical protein